MAKLPNTVRVGTDIVVIETRPEGEDLFESHNGTRHALGALDHQTGEMRIRDESGQSQSQMRDSLLHELVHAALRKANLHHDILKKSNREEDVVARITPWLLLILRENPKAVAYLLEPDA